MEAGSDCLAGCLWPSKSQYFGRTPARIGKFLFRGAACALKIERRREIKWAVDGLTKKAEEGGQKFSDLKAVKGTVWILGSWCCGWRSGIIDGVGTWILNENRCDERRERREHAIATVVL